MLHQRTVSMVVEALTSAEEYYTVVFDFSEGNSRWGTSWDEPESFDEIEIVGVFREFANCHHGPNLYHLMSDKEEYYLVDLLFAMREGE